MPFYPNEVIQQLKSEADITAVIEQFLPLKRSGNGRFVGVCPFHDDHSPSMYVNPTLGIYKCFACGAGGDVFKFVQEHEKIDFNAAVRWVADFCSFELPNVSNPERAEITEERELVRKLNELACEWFEEQLTHSPKAQQYLSSRHITEATRKQFHIGYAPDGREGFVGYAAKKGFSPKECVKAGLAVEKENGGISDKFRDRLMIAIQNLSGAVVAFGGRDLSEKQGDFKRPKYMNSPETILYQKSDILFGLNHSKNAIAKENAVIIVEGYFDLISLYQGGVQNVVAASGTALTETHASILSRYAKTAYLVFDGDAAGQKATLRSLEIVLPKGIGPKVFALSRPDGTKIDPDNFVNERGADAFREELRNAEDWLSYLSHMKDLSSIEARASFITYAKSLIKSIENTELRNQYVKLLSERFDTSRSLNDVNQIHVKHKPTAEQEQARQQLQEEATMVQWNLIPPLEIRFANLLFRNPTLLDRACEFFDMNLAESGIQLLESSVVDEFVNTAIAHYAETGYFSPQALYDILPRQGQLFMEGLPEESWTPPKEINEFYDSLMVLMLRFCDREKKNIQLDSAEGIQKRMDLYAFTQELQKLDASYKKGAIDINQFADNIISCKDRLIHVIH
ncbi:MAG: DNA primase [Fibrobacter sp.]|nr:DNA primase [Fibrobacter sp.]